jgi:tetratricopeptide (TPR) repeat protein
VPRREAPAAARPVEPVPVPEQRPKAPSHPEPVRPSPAQAPSAPPAVLALQKQAEANLNSGQLDQAAAALERAVRIQPRNATLWNELASVRLRQHQPGLAEDLAKKSNVLAKGNRALVRKNWTIIAEARRAKGDGTGAAQAEAKAAR